jgi:hypothetical protein
MATIGCEFPWPAVGANGSCEWDAKGSPHTMPGVDGLATSMTVNIVGPDVTTDWQCGIYDTSGNILTNGKTEIKSLNMNDYGGRSTQTFTFPTSPTLLANTEYHFFIVTESAAGNLAVSWTARAGEQWTEGAYGPTQPPLLDSQTISSSADIIAHIYVTYTPLGAGTGLELGLGQAYGSEGRVPHVGKPFGIR